MNAFVEPQPRRSTWERNKFFVRNRRLSRPKMFNFSTINRVDPEADEKHRQLWFLLNFTQSMHGVT